jgi:hypothetical protein
MTPETDGPELLQLIAQRHQAELAGLRGHLNGDKARNDLASRPAEEWGSQEYRDEMTLAMFAGRAALMAHNNTSPHHGTTDPFDGALSALWSRFGRGNRDGIEGYFGREATHEIVTTLLSKTDPNNGPDVFLFCNALRNVEQVWQGDSDARPYPASRANNSYVWGHMREAFETVAKRAEGTLLGAVCQAAINSKKMDMSTFMYIR